MTEQKLEPTEKPEQMFSPLEKAVLCSGTVAGVGSFIGLVGGGVALTFSYVNGIPMLAGLVAGMLTAAGSQFLSLSYVFHNKKKKYLSNPDNKANYEEFLTNQEAFLSQRKDLSSLKTPELEGIDLISGELPWTSSVQDDPFVGYVNLIIHGNEPS